MREKITWEDNIQKDHARTWTGLIWLKTGKRGEFL
jgi:hypothetical protein